MKKPVLNQTEIRQTMTIAAIFASRMLGLFIIFPVFSVYVLSGAYGQVSALAMGVAMGIYGLTQASFANTFWLALRLLWTEKNDFHRLNVVSARQFNRWGCRKHFHPHHWPSTPRFWRGFCRFYWHF